MNKEPLLSVTDFRVTFHRLDENDKHYELKPITGISLDIYPGEILAVVGASGSGKSLLAHGILGLLPDNADVEGNIRFLGKELTSDSIKKLRGKEIALVPQSTSFLDPTQQAGPAVYQDKGNKNGIQRQKELFQSFDLPKDTGKMYPRELSGGMIRRVLLSTALVSSPRLIIADEPTPGLDLPLAQKAMEDFRSFAGKDNGVLLITHDLELAIATADRIAVFNEGKTIETAQASYFNNPEKLQTEYGRKLAGILKC